MPQQSVQPQELAVYDSAALAGFIVVRTGEFAAFDSNHKLIATFTNQRDAMRAIPRAAP